MSAPPNARAESTRAWNRQSLTVERRALAPVRVQTPVRLALPFPPAHGLFVAAPSGERVLSPPYRAWRHAATWEIRAKGARRIGGPVALALTFEAALARAELTRLARAPIALLVELALIDGDGSDVLRRLTLDRGTAAGCDIVIEACR